MRNRILIKLNKRESGMSGMVAGSISAGLLYGGSIDLIEYTLSEPFKTLFLAFLNNFFLDSAFVALYILILRLLTQKGVANV
jgi:hypothetical protein